MFSLLGKKEREHSAARHTHTKGNASVPVLVATHNGGRLMLTTPFSEYGYQLPLTSGAHEFSYASGAPRETSLRAMKPTETLSFSLYLLPSLFLSLSLLFLFLSLSVFRSATIAFFAPTITICARGGRVGRPRLDLRKTYIPPRADNDRFSRFSDPGFFLLRFCLFLSLVCFLVRLTWDSRCPDV